jgi:hypothetical protein
MCCQSCKTGLQAVRLPFLMLPSRQLRSLTVTRWLPTLHSAVGYRVALLGLMAMVLIMALTAVISEATQQMPCADIISVLQ